MRSRPDMGVWGPTGTDTAARTKNTAGGSFSNGVVKGMIGRGRGRVFVPVDITVSALDMILVGMEVGMDALTRNDHITF